MYDIKHILLFLLGCIGTRLLLTYFAKVGSYNIRRMIGVFAGIVSIGFATIWLFDLRKTGIETGGKEIWWDHARPLHALLFGSFAVMTLVYKNSDAWVILLIDTIMGLALWSSHTFPDIFPSII